MNIRQHLRRILRGHDCPDLLDIQRDEITRLRATNDELRAVNRHLNSQVATERARLDLTLQRGQLVEHARAGAGLAYLQAPVTGGRVVVDASPTVAGGAA